MNIQFNTFSLGNKLNIPMFSDAQKSNNNITNVLTRDTFEKSQNQISFKSDVIIRKDGPVKIPRPPSPPGGGDGGGGGDPFLILAALGFVGLNLAMTAAIASKDNPEKIFLPDGTFLMDTNEKTLKSDEILADADDGVLHVKGTPIHIDANKYDFADVEKGIYKNYDGTVDIDLLNNKYVDVKNGVFIDPEAKISMIKQADGTIKNIVIPDFINNPHFLGQSMQSNYSPLPNLDTRSEFLEKHGELPEEYYENHSFVNHVVDKYRQFRVTPDDNRSIGRKLLDFLNPSTSYYGMNKFDRSKSYDIFGREIMDIKNSDGSYSRIALDEGMKEIVTKYNLKGESIGEIADFIEKAKSKEYIIEHFPVEMDATNFVHMDNLQEFLTRLADKHSDVANVITQDAIADVVSDSDTYKPFLDFLKEALDNAVG